MSIFRIFGRKRTRRYPIKKDEAGVSARRRCFEMFAEQIPVDEIVEKVGVKIETVCKYHQQWKKNPDLEGQLAFVKELFKKTAPDRERNIELFSRSLGITKEQFEALLAQPHGLRRLITGKLYFPAHAAADQKRQMALELAWLISDHLINNGGKFEDVYFALQRWMKENQIWREEKDQDITEENKLMPFVHGVLAAAAKREWEGRVKPDTLSEEERDNIIKYGISVEIKQTEKFYWLRIVNLMFEGLTEEQAREKIYQDIVSGGNLNRAKMMRELQDRVHPLKPKDQSPPPTPLPPSAPA